MFPNESRVVTAYHQTLQSNMGDKRIKTKIIGEKERLILCNIFRLAPLFRASAINK